MEKKQSKVCVTGGSGYIGSLLVKILLQKGYVVHATLRNLVDENKVNLLKSLPDAETRLVLFQVDICNPKEFEQAIYGCHYVFHLATPMKHTHITQDMAEEAVAGVRSIADCCVRSKTVKRLIYTASIMAASPLKEEGPGFKDCIDESCWTPLHIPFSFCNDHTWGYTRAKTLAEKELLNYNGSSNNNGLEVVTLPCGLVGGDTLLSYTPASVEAILSPLTGNIYSFQAAKFLQELLCSIPIVHVDDVCSAHIFCMEQPYMTGRFLCVAASPTIQDFAQFYRQNCHQLNLLEEFTAKPENTVICESEKLQKMGFEFKYGFKEILNDSMNCGKRLGAIHCCNNTAKRMFSNK